MREKKMSTMCCRKKKVTRPVFAEPKTWEKSVTVAGSQTSVVNFVISGK